MMPAMTQGYSPWIKPNVAHLTRENADDGRAEALARLLPLWPSELSNVSLAGRRHVVRRLAKALRAERLRGRAGHFAYSVARHVELAKALRSERAALTALEKAAAPPPKYSRHV
jgi:hypothetical protein